MNFLSFLFLISFFAFAIFKPLTSAYLIDVNVETILNDLKLNKHDDRNERTVRTEPAVSQCSLDQAIVDEIEGYRDVVNQIIDLFMTGNFKGKTYDLLAEMTDKFGSRLTGSQFLEDAIDWVIERASGEGYETHTENVTAPHWIRNEESLVMLSPRVRKIGVLGLGQTIGTPSEGITADLYVVSSFEELTNTSELAVGKIVLFDVPFTTYSETVQYRARGAIEAAKAGAVASIIRSVTDFSMHTLHTGDMNYDDNVTKIPGAAITLEDSTMFHRMQDRGETITLQLNMAEVTLPDILTRNTILEIPGAELPQEVVVVSGHLDSWDVGNGVMDDGGGCVVSWMAGKALLELGLTPRRTHRTIMFTAEELGIYGGDAYFAAHASERENFQLMMESDFGTFFPKGIEFSGNNESTCMMDKIVSLTERINTTELVKPADTPDLEQWGVVGVPRGSLNMEAERYFWFHHSDADRLEIDTPETLDRIAALWTAVSYVAADVSFRFPQGYDNEFQ